MSAQPVLILLAAGAATRLGEPKLTADLGGGLSALDSLLNAAAMLSDRAVVLGAHPIALPPLVRGLLNPDWSRGRMGSLQCGVRAYPGRDLLIAPVDVPLVPRSVILGLLETWQTASRPALGWLAPRHRASGRHGHPLLIGRDLAARLHEAGTDCPLKDFRALANPLLEWPTDCAAVIDDLDTPGDLLELRRRRGFPA